LKRIPYSFFIAACLLFFSNASRAQDSSKYYFYFGRDYGSESMFNPVASIINGGFDILQSESHSRVLSTIKFGIGAKNVWENLRDPLPQISKFGWDRFISQEVFPLSLSIEKAQYFPNYTLHLIGGGMNSQMMYEWYRFHHVPLPGLIAGVSFATLHFINEAVENDLYVGVNVDPIADVWIFDIAGPILFSIDNVKQFFSSTLGLTDWSGQVAWSPATNTIENHGQNFVMRYKPPFLDRTRLFYYFGDSGMFGLSFDRSDQTSISVGAGFVAKSLRQVDAINGARSITVELGWIAGVFYDRENSLLASLIVSDRINENVKLNIYPGILPGGDLSPGLFVSVGKEGQFIAGITLRYSPVGIAHRFQ
jgi:hypothetical protein